MTIENAVELTAAEAIARLVVFQEHRNPCEDGHIEHGPNDHLGRRIIHSRSPRGFGADWDEVEVHAFITNAIRIVDLGNTEHPIAVFSDDGHGPRWMKFDARSAA